MQSLLQHQNVQYESVNVPTELVPYIKTLIRNYNASVFTSMLDMHSLMPQKPNFSSQSIQIPPLPPPPAHFTESKSYSKLDDPKVIIKKTPAIFTDRDHVVCIHWMNNNCRDKNCDFNHFTGTEFKTRMCKHWQKGYCKYDDSKCSYAHGFSDQYHRLKSLYTIDKNPIRERSRSRERK